MQKQKIVIIGAGNVGTNITKALFAENITIVQIISKSIANAKKLATMVNAEYSDNLNDLKPADLYLICTPDSIISKICEHENLNNKFVVHTAGSIDMNILDKNTSNYGVFYSLQTFNKDAFSNFNEIPICIEASNNENLKILENIASLISLNVYFINSNQRLKLHVAAVFSNNFVNHIMAITNDFIEDESIDRSILKPLVQKTFDNILNNNPKEIQTGPAKRNDRETINKHLNLLKNNSNMVALYRVLTENIMNTYNF